MDRFELNWPNMDAQLLTDGWRCRIVWRHKSQRRGRGTGMGGTIDNNLLCLRRVAESLDGAPYLLNALKARGHDRLASQIEEYADAGTADAPAAPRPARNKAAPKRAARREATRLPERKPDRDAPSATESSLTAAWLERLEGEAAFEAASGKRAKIWHELGSPGSTDETVFLKTPAAKGKPEWVLKRTWADSKRKAEYVAAASFKGIAAWLLAEGADAGFIDRLLDATADVVNDELMAAATAWRSARAETTH